MTAGQVALTAFAQVTRARGTERSVAAAPSVSLRYPPIVDARLRQLERRAAQGDDLARRQLRAARRRSQTVATAASCGHPATPHTLLCSECRPNNEAVIVGQVRRGTRRHVVLPHTLLDGFTSHARCGVKLSARIALAWGTPNCAGCMEGLDPEDHYRLGWHQNEARWQARLQPCDPLVCGVFVCRQPREGEPCWGEHHPDGDSEPGQVGYSHSCQGHTLDGYILPFHEWVPGARLCDPYCSWERTSLGRAGEVRSDRPAPPTRSRRRRKSASWSD